MNNRERVNLYFKEKDLLDDKYELSMDDHYGVCAHESHDPTICRDKEWLEKEWKSNMLSEDQLLIVGTASGLNMTNRQRMYCFDRELHCYINRLVDKYEITTELKNDISDKKLDEKWLEEEWILQDENKNED